MKDFPAFFSDYVQKNPPKDNLVSGEYVKQLIKEFNTIKQEFILNTKN